MAGESLFRLGLTETEDTVLSSPAATIAVSLFEVESSTVTRSPWIFVASRLALSSSLFVSVSCSTCCLASVTQRSLPERRVRVGVVFSLLCRYNTGHVCAKEHIIIVIIYIVSCWWVC